MFNFTIEITAYKREVRISKQCQSISKVEWNIVFSSSSSKFVECGMVHINFTQILGPVSNFKQFTPGISKNSKLLQKALLGVFIGRKKIEKRAHHGHLVLIFPSHHISFDDDLLQSLKVLLMIR